MLTPANGSGKKQREPVPFGEDVGRDSASDEREARLQALVEAVMELLDEHGGRDFSFKQVLESLERDVLVRSLKKFQGHQHKTSLFLGLKPSTLCVKLQKYGVVIRRVEVDIRYPADSAYYTHEREAGRLA